MMCDLAFAVMIYATATEHMLLRQGSGRMQHIDLAHLWSQYGVGSNRVVVRRVSGEQIVEDLRTKALSRAAIARHAEHLGYINLASSHWRKENHELNCRAFGRSAHEEAVSHSFSSTRA